MVWTPWANKEQRLGRWSLLPDQQKQRPAPEAARPGGPKPELIFLREELQAGLFSARVALEISPAAADVVPHRENASIAYGTVLCMLNHTRLGRAERQEVEAGLAELRGVLTQLGVRV